MHINFTLRGKPIFAQWALLVLLSLTFIALLELIRLPAAILLGAMAAAIVVAGSDGHPPLPGKLYVLAQGFVACLVARSLKPEIFDTILGQWPVFLAGVGSVILASSGLGALLARLKVLPGTTAVWGSSPGAATVMVLMSEAYGADARLVAFMQFLRLVLVALVASAVARLWGLHPAGPVAPLSWFPDLPFWPFCATFALAVVGSLVGARSAIPAGALLVPLGVGIALSASHLLRITLAPSVMACCYAVVGWMIGLRFNRDVLRYAARALPAVLLSIFSLIAICGALAYLLHLATCADGLTAYLAMSPGGADSVAIIAAASKVDMPFVMAMQTARFLIVVAIGPGVARIVARWVARKA